MKCGPRSKVFKGIIFNKYDLSLFEKDPSLFIIKIIPSYHPVAHTCICYVLKDNPPPKKLSKSRDVYILKPIWVLQYYMTKAESVCGLVFVIIKEDVHLRYQVVKTAKYKTHFCIYSNLWTLVSFSINKCEQIYLSSNTGELNILL